MQHYVNMGPADILCGHSAVCALYTGVGKVGRKGSHLIHHHVRFPHQVLQDYSFSLGLSNSLAQHGHIAQHTLQEPEENKTT